MLLIVYRQDVSVLLIVHRLAVSMLLPFKEQTPCGAAAPGKPALGLVFSEGRAGRPRAAMPGDAVPANKLSWVEHTPLSVRCMR